VTSTETSILVMNMKIGKIATASGIAVALLLVCGIKGAMAAPDWIPATTELSYELAWDSEADFYDFTNLDGGNTTLYTQLWLKNDTITNETNLLAAGMLDKGGSVFSSSPQMSGADASLSEAILRGLLGGISQADYDALATVWDALFLLINSTLTSTDINVTEITVANMDNALLIQDIGVSSAFDYLLFGYRGDRVLSVFSVDVPMDWLPLLSDVTANNATLYNDFQNIFLIVLSAYMLIFVVFAMMFQSIGSASMSLAVATEVAPAGISVATAAEVTEITTFASAWGQVATIPGGLPGYEPFAVAIIGAATLAALTLKVRKSRLA
jgi:hypothetical protein